MKRKVIRMSMAEFEARLRAAGPRTSDDVSITTDGRRLDSKQAVLDWWAEVEAERTAAATAPADDEPA